MALIVVTWDLPGNQEQMEVYTAHVGERLPRILAAPGIVEFRAYRNPMYASPQVMAIQEYDSLESARRWAETAEYKQIVLGLRQDGCTNITIQFWDKSPISPDPLRP
jgi:heme-degrading monooxygenase HmoA